MIVQVIDQYGVFELKRQILHGKDGYPLQPFPVAGTHSHSEERRDTNGTRHWQNSCGLPELRHAALRYQSVCARRMGGGRRAK